VLALVGRGLDPGRLADSLGASHVLEGGLQRSGDRMRLRLRLVDARDGSTRWSETYDRALEDVFRMQDDIARGVARELGVRLSSAADTRRPDRPAPPIAAYELYLRGNDQVLLRSDSGVQEGTRYFERAIAIDPQYAAAHAGLARMLLVTAGRALPPDSVTRLQERAREAASRALALDDSVADGHASLGLLKGFIELDLASGETELRRAIELDPTRALPRQWLAQLYIRMGRPAEALAEARLALEADPLSPSAHAEVAHALLVNRRYDEALEGLARIGGVQPPLRRAAFYATQAHAGKGAWADAVAAARPRAGDSDSWALSLYGWALGRAGRRDEALNVQAQLLERWRAEGSCAFCVAAVYAGIGDFDRALGWLDAAIEDGSVLRPLFNVTEPAFDELRADARFEPVRARLGLQKR
jgi:eukaryotic-like serine/threonine-protein kinase